MPQIASQVVGLQENCSTHEVQRQKNSCHRNCCESVVAEGHGRRNPNVWRVTRRLCCNRYLSVCLSVCYKLTSSKTTDRIVVKILPETNLWTLNFSLNYVSHTDTDSRFKPAPHYRRSALAAFFKMFLFVACFKVSRRLRADQGGRLSEADNAWRRPGDAGHSGHGWTGKLRRRA